ncbi:hypothetical protein [Leucobacter sp. M11]|uniref:hypothetical protein n=1 Tax=Leucobacter sp. M11 TaxID=2993565 RepID=UPI002D7E33EE|nr:hypothetical protein [Leucobacter sp. M11]MEB4614784.1 hypothetical protein [Leucobacter sp. M11]
MQLSHEILAVLRADHEGGHLGKGGVEHDGTGAGAIAPPTALPVVLEIPGKKCQNIEACDSESSGKFTERALGELHASEGCKWNLLAPAEAPQLPDASRNDPYCFIADDHSGQCFLPDFDPLLGRMIGLAKPGCAATSG